MARSVLITQCLQEDFMGLLEPRQPLPNRLHIGHREAERLLGPDPERGPLAQLLAWALAEPPERLALIHIRDWHDPDDPRQREHLATFGPHCLRGTRGAGLVLDLDRRSRERGGAWTVDAIALNDFEDTRLGAALGEAIGADGDRGLVRVGVIGVWTEAKVSFLCYDLKTRGRLAHLATASALTASASRAQHMNALEQLRRLLGVEAFDSVGAFQDWLVPASRGASDAGAGADPLPGATRLGGGEADNGAAVGSPRPGASAGPRAGVVAGSARFGPRVDLEPPARPLDAADLDLVGYLYKEAARLSLAELGGGFSGARVFRVAAADALGHDLAPSVAKLGPRDLIGRERVAFEGVEGILGNSAPSVRGFADLGSRAGIRYAYAAMGSGRVTTLKALYESGAPDAEVERVLDAALTDVLGRLYAAAAWERLPLLAHYGFSAALAPRVRGNVAALVGEEAARGDTLAFPGGVVLPNLAGFYDGFLASHGLDEGEHRYVAYVHGDLNAANVLVDARGNVWVIDFFHAARSHVLKDLAKLENDLCYVLTPIDQEEALAEAIRMTVALAAVEDLGAPLPERLPGIVRPELARAWSLVRRLRAHAARLCRDDRDAGQLAVALLRYAAHTLTFAECSPLQRRWALAGGCAMAEVVERGYAGR